MSPCTLFRLPQRTRETRFKVKSQDSRYNRTSGHWQLLRFSPIPQPCLSKIQLNVWNKGYRWSLTMATGMSALMRGPIVCVCRVGTCVDEDKLRCPAMQPIVVIYNDQATFYRSKLNLAGVVAFRTLPWCYTLSDIQHDGTTRYCHISIHPPERDLPKTSFVMSPAVNDLSSLETLLPSGEGMRWETAASRGNRRSPGIMNELRVTVILFLYKLFHGLDWFKWMVSYRRFEDTIMLRSYQLWPYMRRK
ncbi:hypothetical protein C8Q75DRAFT_123505 [Abortiporus biennis]|nr:hypothetical protein C8Q75DRAFT_123505 [Abortiporus biennis]